MKILVIIPTYNEKKNIAKMIISVLTLDHKEKDAGISLLVVDDNSPDGTSAVVSDKMMNGEFKDRLFLIKREKKMGLGTAYRAGFKFAIEQGFDYVITMDCDFSHDPSEIINFVNRINNNAVGMIVGSRYKDGIRIMNWKMKRLLISYFANIYSMVITGLKITDLTGGFNMYNVACLKKINLDGVKSKGYAFQIEMKYRMKKTGCRIDEIPITFYERTMGRSKMSKSIIFEAFFMVIRLRLGLYK